MFTDSELAALKVSDRNKYVKLLEAALENHMFASSGKPPRRLSECPVPDDVTNDRLFALYEEVCDELDRERSLA